MELAAPVDFVYHVHGYKDLAAFGELEGVADEVHEDLAQAGGVGAQFAGGAFGDIVEQVDAFAGGLVGEEIKGGLDAVGEVEGLFFEFELTGLNLGEV